MNKQEIPLSEMLAYSTHQAACVLSLCERTVRNMAHRGDIRCIRVGKRILIPRTAVEDYVGYSQRSASTLEPPPPTPEAPVPEPPAWAAPSLFPVPNLENRAALDHRPRASRRRRILT